MGPIVSKSTKPHLVATSVRPGLLAILSGLFFLSGATGLIFQVLWMYRLGLVFGNAVHATAATLSAFFLGLAVGGWVWGNAARRFSRLLLVYGLMELGVALTALLWLPGLAFYKAQYSTLVSFVDGHRFALVLSKFLFSTTLLFLPAALMGGTFPVLAQLVGEGRRRLANRGTLLYALNTLGAALGVFLAGFWFVSQYGVRATYLMAVALAATVGSAAVLLDRFFVVTPSRERRAPPPERSVSRVPTAESAPTISYSLLVALAFGTGLLALAAETLWVRMFAQVLQNSVYSFSAILVVFLIALGMGGLLSHALVRLNLSPVRVLLTLLYVGAFLVGMSPVIFDAATNGLSYVASRADWPDYLASVFKLSILVFFPPTLVIGAVFPFLLKVAPRAQREPGRIVGRLVWFNSIGGAIGPLLAGFVFLDVLGLWNSVKLLAVGYGLLALLTAASAMAVKTWTRGIWAAALLAGLFLLPSPPVVRLAAGEELLDVWQSRDGAVTVVKSAENVQMRLDNFYVLGDTRSALVEQMQGHIPLLLHPAPTRVLFLGMGTGITAGASLNHRVERVVVVELVSNVIRAAKRFFSSWVNGLFEDPRVEIVADDARSLLLGTTERYDVIVGDLFTPWHAGTGTLYTVEHFKLAKDRLAPGGLFAQWLPLYQLTPEGFETIAATFASVFPVVTLWRADFSGTRATVALIGQQTDARLDQEVLLRNSGNVVGDRNKVATRHMAGLFYLGNLAALGERLTDAELNTDDRRTVEFSAPILSQRANAGQGTYLTGHALEQLLTELATKLPFERDPYLAALPEEEIRYAKVGFYYFRYLQRKAEGKQREAEDLLGHIRTLAPEFLGGRGASR